MKTILRNITSFFSKKNTDRKTVDNKIVFTEGKTKNPVEKYSNLEHFKVGDKEFFIAKENEKYGIIDLAGKIILPFEYEYITRFNADEEVFLRVEKDEKFGVIDLNGKIILPIEYDEMGFFDVKGVVFLDVQKNEKWGVVDLDGEIVLPFEYGYMSVFDVEGKIFFKVEKDEKYGIIDLDGKVILPFEFEKDFFASTLVDISSNFPNVFVKEGRMFFIVEKDEKCGVVDSNGKTIVPFEVENYYYISTFDVENKTFFSIKGDKIIDLNGEILPFEEYDYKEIKEYIYRQEEEEREKEEIKYQILEEEKRKNEKQRRSQLKERLKFEMKEQGIISNDDDDNLRGSVPQDVQDRVWNRDGGKCVKCGSREKLEFDHIIPFSKGGSNTYRNLQILCEKCNRSKSNNIG